MIEPPAYRRNVFSGARRQEWDDWSRHVQMDSSLSRAEKKAFHDIFAAEGGMRKAPNGTAVAGILQNTLNWLSDEKEDVIPRVTQKHGRIVKTTHLDYEDVKDVYKGYFDKNIKASIDGKKGSKIFSLYDDGVSSAVADIIFRDGVGNAGVWIQNIVNKYDPEQNIEEDGVLGSGTMNALKRLTNFPEKKRLFLDSMADKRRPHEKDRNDYFRFKN